MLGFLRVFSKAHRQNKRNADRVLRAVLAQSRLPVFFERGHVADTVTGRFDLLVLHAFVVMRTLRWEPALEGLNQSFLDALFANIDASYREMGVSDPRMPRKMRQTAQAFYGRLGAYENGLTDGGLVGLKEALARNLFAENVPDDAALEAMAHYAIGCLGTLALLNQGEWERGKLKFPKYRPTGAR